MGRIRSREELKAIFASFMRARMGLRGGGPPPGSRPVNVQAPHEGAGNVSKKNWDKYHHLNDAAREWIEQHAKHPWNEAKLAEYVKFLNERPEVEALVQDLKSNPDRHPAIQIGPVGPNVPVTYLLGWGTGGDTPIHDHADSKVAALIREGSVREEVFATAGRDMSLLTTRGTRIGAQRITRTHKAGSVLKLKDTYIHRMANVQKPYAVTVHSYYPPLDQMGFYSFDQKTGGSVGGADTGRLKSIGMYQDDNVLMPKKVYLKALG